VVPPVFVYSKFFFSLAKNFVGTILNDTKKQQTAFIFRQFTPHNRKINKIETFLYQYFYVVVYVCHGISQSKKRSRIYLMP